MGNERERIGAGKNNRIASKNEVHWVDATLSPAVCKSLSDCYCLLSRVPKSEGPRGNRGKCIGQMQLRYGRPQIAMICVEIGRKCIK